MMEPALSRFLLVLIAAAAATDGAPQDYRTTPVPILKQINRHNDDGSYNFGYEAADGTFKIETKYPSGEVAGKYGYIGDDGKLREVEYGASRRGFEPSGAGINVPPPTLTNNAGPSGEDYDDGQYREDPSVYYKPKAHRFAPSRQGRYHQTPRYTYGSQALQPTYHFTTPRPQYHSNFQKPAAFRQPTYQFADPRSRHYSALQQPTDQYGSPFLTYDPNLFVGHPAANVDLSTGSFSVSYSG